MSERVIWARNRETGETGMVRAHTVDQHPDLYDVRPTPELLGNLPQDNHFGSEEE